MNIWLSGDMARSSGSKALTQVLPMLLKDLIAPLRCKVVGSPDIEVAGIALDSREVEKGTLFAAMPGAHVDGCAFIGDAVGRGACAVLVERAGESVPVTQVIVEDIRGALAEVSARFYGYPSRRIKLVGVTGTNGKTTTTYLIESILKAAGFNPGVIGTINYRYGSGTYPAPHTTPQAPQLQRVLKEMADSGVTHCVMEVSSHSLEQKRVLGCVFSVAVFTNLTHEHLDYHRTMEGYFGSKKALFSMAASSGGTGAVNIDDERGGLIKKEFPGSMTYSLRQGADIYPLGYSLLPGGTEAEVSTPAGIVTVRSHLVGEYNLQNILAAISAGCAIGLDPKAIGAGIAALERVPGRLEKIEALEPKRFNAYVDYAHTADALERTLNALRKVTRGRLITVFGCGGNRDRLKRPEMGEVSVRLSDITIVTSDNPRDEDPLEIIREVEAGIKGVARCAPGDSSAGKCYMTIPERSEAIKKAVETARNGDTVLLAGKGHEDCQIVKGQRLRFSDFEALDDAIKGLSEDRALN